jgi:hypothetical protein
VLKAVAEALLENETLGREDLDALKRDVLAKRATGGADVEA